METKEEIKRIIRKNSTLPFPDWTHKYYAKYGAFEAMLRVRLETLEELND